MRKILGILTALYLLFIAMSIDSIANYSLSLLVILVIVGLLLIALYAIIEYKKKLNNN